MAEALSSQEIEAGLKKILWQNDQQMVSPGAGQGAKKRLRGKRNRNRKKTQGEEEEAVNISEGTSSSHLQGNSNVQSRQSGKAPSDLESKPTNEELKELEKDFIFPLKKRSLKFPMAKYFCRLCEYHCDTVAICRKHMKDTRHLRLKVIRTTDIMLRNLPEPSPAHAAALTSLVENIFKDHALTEEEVKQRYSVLDKLTRVVQSKIPGINFTVYGSTASGFALKTSDLNLDLTCEDAPKQLCEIFMLLKNDTSGYFEKVQSDFSAKVQ
jgi:hypothetical protein